MKKKNVTEPQDKEDKRLLKIRSFAGSVKDYKSYWEDRIKKQS